jgi:hypothetical protein
MHFPALDEHGAVDVPRVAPATLDARRADELVADSVRGSIFRPHDIQRASVDPTELVYVPFYRVRVTVDGFHVGLTGASVRVGGAVIPIPSGGSRHEAQDVVVCGRREFPFAARLARGRFGQASPLAALRLDELVPAASFAFDHAGRLQANVARARAEDDAVRVVRKANEPRSGALFAQYDVRPKEVDAWLHPIFLASYRYFGAARGPQEEESCFVALCGRTGGVVAESHPSALRSVVARARKFFWE